MRRRAPDGPRRPSRLGPPRTGPPRKPRAPYGPQVVRRLLRGLAAGHGLRALCRSPDMPTRPTVMRWRNTRPAFARAVAKARADGWLFLPGRPARATPQVVDALYLRLCGGEPLIAICRDPRMPARSTVQAWATTTPAIARRLRLGRQAAHWAKADRFSFR